MAHGTILADKVAAHEADLQRRHQAELDLERTGARVQERMGAVAAKSADRFADLAVLSGLLAVTAAGGVAVSRVVVGWVATELAAARSAL